MRYGRTRTSISPPHTHFQSVFLISDMIEYSTFDCPFDFRSLILRIRCATTFLFTCYAPQHDAKRPTKIAKILQAACGTAQSSRCHPGALMPTPAASLTLPQRSGSIRRCVCTHVCVSLFGSIDGLAVETPGLRVDRVHSRWCGRTAGLRCRNRPRRVSATGRGTRCWSGRTSAVRVASASKATVHPPHRRPTTYRRTVMGTHIRIDTDTYTGTYAHAYTRPQATSPVSPTPDTPA